MISKWGPADFKDVAGNRWTAIEEFLADSESRVETDDLNQKQRIILVAEQFDYEVLVGAEWLHAEHAVDIKCIRIELALDSTGAMAKSEYLTLTQVYPTKELDEIALRRGSRRQTSGGPALMHPEFLAVIAAYNGSALPDIRAEGTAPNYRIIHPADWPFKKFLAYSFHWTYQDFVISLTVHPDAPQGFSELLMPFDGTPVASGQKSLEWDRDHNNGRGRLLAKFPIATPAETVAQAMSDLVTMTRATVSNKLKPNQAEIGSTGN